MSADGPPGPWLCFQLGAREHYAVPRALHSAGLLSALITDAWSPSERVLSRLLPTSVRDRFHSDLSNAAIHAFTLDSALFEVARKFKRLDTWQTILERNEWFQARALQAVHTAPRRGPDPIALFSYSYAARRLLEHASSRGWTTVLGQIDPGPAEARIVERLHIQHPALCSAYRPAPAEYWDRWRRECEIADFIMVNSRWSYSALVEEGLPAEKIRIVPLAYAAPAEAISFPRTYPRHFSANRPLRILFLGQVNLRKGIAPLLDAMRIMAGTPVEFTIAGPVQISIPAEMRNSSQARWLGGVDRRDAASLYKKADVFVFPTLSDGFGLTQLEARAWKLPVVASRNCGDVVVPGVNGILLDTVTGDAIAEALVSLLSDPSELERLSVGGPSDENSIEDLSARLSTLLRESVK